MNKSTATITAVLALLTGLVLGQLGSLTVTRFQPPPSGAAAPAQELATVRTFYDELNHFLATGERDIESMLAFDFVDHTGFQANGRNSEEVMTGWAATSSLLPQLRFEVVDLQGWGTFVAARIDVHPGPPSPIPGVPLTSAADSSVIEFLRIEHGKIVERWSNDDRLPGMAWTLSTDFDRTGPSLSGPVIQRFSIPSGQEIALSGADTVVLRVVSGELQLNRASLDPQRDERPTSDPIASDQTRIVNATSPIHFRNLSPATTELLAFSLYGLHPTDRTHGDLGEAVSISARSPTALAYMPLRLTGSSDERLRLSVTEITLPAGTLVLPHTPDLVEEIVVLDGALEASVHSGRALASLGDGQSHPFDTEETASAGQGFSASALATMSYRVVSAQPVRLLVMTIEPVPSAEAQSDA